MADTCDRDREAQRKKRNREASQRCYRKRKTRADDLESYTAEKEEEQMSLNRQVSQFQSYLRSLQITAANIVCAERHGPRTTPGTARPLSASLALHRGPPSAVPHGPASLALHRGPPSAVPHGPASLALHRGPPSAVPHGPASLALHRGPPSAVPRGSASLALHRGPPSAVPHGSAEDIATAGQPGATRWLDPGAFDIHQLLQPRTDDTAASSTTRQSASSTTRQSAPPTSRQSAPFATCQSATPTSRQSAPPTSRQSAPFATCQSATPTPRQSATPTSRQSAPPTSRQSAPFATRQSAPHIILKSAPPPIREFASSTAGPERGPLSPSAAAAPRLPSSHVPGGGSHQLVPSGRHYETARRIDSCEPVLEELLQDPELQLLSCWNEGTAVPSEEDVPRKVCITGDDHFNRALTADCAPDMLHTARRTSMMRLIDTRDCAATSHTVVNQPAAAILPPAMTASYAMASFQPTVSASQGDSVGLALPTRWQPWHHVHKQPRVSFQEEGRELLAAPYSNLANTGWRLETAINPVTNFSALASNDVAMESTGRVTFDPMEDATSSDECVDEDALLSSSESIDLQQMLELMKEQKEIGILGYDDETTEVDQNAHISEHCFDEITLQSPDEHVSMQHVLEMSTRQNEKDIPAHASRMIVNVQSVQPFAGLAASSKLALNVSGAGGHALPETTDVDFINALPSTSSGPTDSIYFGNESTGARDEGDKLDFLSGEEVDKYLNFDF